MKIEEFTLERYQSLWENKVEINLTESGVHPYTLRELLTDDEIERVLDIRLGYGWTNGSPELRERIASRYPGATRKNVLVTNGSAESNFVHTWSMLEPGDEVAVMLPNYLQIWGLARSLGCEVKPFHLDPARNWAPDLDELERVVTPQTKLVCICHPNNPTGALLEQEEMERIVEIAEAHDARIYADEVYKGVELDGRERPSFREITPEATVASGLSKALAHPGLRIGWLVGSEETIAKAWHHNDYTTIAASPLCQAVAEIILEPSRREAILERNRSMLRENLGLLEDWVARQNGRFHLVPPQAGGMAFLRYDFGVPVNSTKLAEWMRTERSLLIVPGDAYGLDGFIRLGIGEEHAKLEDGLARLESGLAEADLLQLV